MQWLATSTDHFYSRGPCGWNRGVLDPSWFQECIFCSTASPVRQKESHQTALGINFPFFLWAEISQLNLLPLEMGKMSSEGYEAPSCISSPGKQSFFSLVKMEEELCPASEEGMTCCPHNTGQTQSVGVYCPGFDCPECVCKAVFNTDHLGIRIC